MLHLGIEISEGRYGYKLKRSNYAWINYKSTYRKGKGPGLREDGIHHTLKWCLEYRRKCLENFDLNMKYYKNLKRREFRNEINKLKKMGFYEIKDLKEVFNMSGYYVMILDKYKQMYIGTSSKIGYRIKDHWKGQKPLDRLLYPIDAVDTSIISIDSFRPLDTTRVLVKQDKKLYDKEDYYIEKIRKDFLCNRVSGGDLNKYRNNEFKVYLSAKKRKLK